MIITTDRKEFDEVLKNGQYSLMLIFGQDEKTAQEIERLASDSAKAENWNIPVLIQDLEILSEKERTDWYKDASHCALLSKPDANDQRKVVEQVAFNDLRTPKGVITMRKINAAFGRADKGADKP